MAGGGGAGGEGRGAEEALEAGAGDFGGRFVMDVLLVGGEEGVFFFREGGGFEGGGEGVGGLGEGGGGVGGRFAGVDAGFEVEGGVGLFVAVTKVRLVDRWD